MKKLLLPLIIILFAMESIKAQTADEIIEKYIQARGGRERFDSLRSVYMEGSKESYGYGSQIQIVVEQGKLYREDAERSYGKSIKIITEKEGWSIYTKPKRKIIKLTDSALTPVQYKLDIEGGLINYAAKGHKIELIGKDTAIDGTACFKLKFTSKTGTEVMYWFNMISYLKEQSSITENISVDDKGSIVIVQDTINYKNYKSVAGILFPYSQNMTVTDAFTKKKKGSINTYYRKIEVNVPVDPQLYNPDKAK